MESSLNLLNPRNAMVGLQDFLSDGGPIMVVIMIATFIMWALIFERWAYYAFNHQRIIKEALREWKARKDHKSAFAHWIRNQIVSEVKVRSDRNVNLIKTLVVVAPLLGLLGTVTGMVEVFDVLANTGASDIRSMASGVSKATITTMAGMVAALSGIVFSDHLEKKSNREAARLSDQLELG